MRTRLFKQAPKPVQPSKEEIFETLAVYLKALEEVNRYSSASALITLRNKKVVLFNMFNKIENIVDWRNPEHR